MSSLSRSGEKTLEEECKQNESQHVAAKQASNATSSPASSAEVFATAAGQRRAVVSKDEFTRLRVALLEHEKELCAKRRAVNQERQSLPWHKLDKNYVFQLALHPTHASHAPPTTSSSSTPAEGIQSVSLVDLFRGHSYLIVYHFMFDDSATSLSGACKSCSCWLDNFNGVLPHLSPRCSFVAVAKAAPELLCELREHKKWNNVLMVSSLQNDFNHEFGVEFTEEERQRGGNYNYGRDFPYQRQAPGLSVFVLDETDKQTVYHCYSTYGPGLAELNAMFPMLDLLPEGRNERVAKADSEDKKATTSTSKQAPNMYWVKHKEEYHFDPMNGLSFHSK